MYLRNNKWLIKITLFFFVSMVGYNPALAESRLPTNTSAGSLAGPIPVSYVTQDQAEQIFEEAQSRGYTIEEGSLQLLAELEQPGQTPDVAEATKEKKSCPETERTKDNSGKTISTEGSTIQQSPECTDDKKDSNTSEPLSSEKPMAVPFPEPQPVPQPEPVPPPQPQQPAVQTNIGIQADIGYGHGGGGGDSGKVFFILAGIMVIAAFIMYAGKYIADIASGKDFKVWWEFIFSNTYLSTRSGQHGRLNGLKIATGFVSSDLIQVALVGEFGNTNIDLILDEYSDPTPLEYSATYWMLGATARLHLSDKLVNASYLYLDFMGGKTSQGSADTIGMARLGASFGVNDYLRLGASIGAHYIGLDEDQGFANHGDNYWTTFGFEMGVKF